jgi:hypothetical protein
MQRAIEQVYETKMSSFPFITIAGQEPFGSVKLTASAQIAAERLMPMTRGRPKEARK